MWVIERGNSIEQTCIRSKTTIKFIGLKRPCFKKSKSLVFVNKISRISYYFQMQFILKALCS